MGTGKQFRDEQIRHEDPLSGREVTWPCILLYPREGEGWGQPRILAYHGSSFNGQRTHPHAHITPD